MKAKIVKVKMFFWVIFLLTILVMALRIWDHSRFLGEGRDIVYPSSARLYDEFDKLWRKEEFLKILCLMDKYTKSLTNYVPVLILASTFANEYGAQAEQSLAILERIREVADQDVSFASPLFCEQLDKAIGCETANIAKYQEKGRSAEWRAKNWTPLNPIEERKQFAFKRGHSSEIQGSKREQFIVSKGRSYFPQWGWSRQKLHLYAPNVILDGGGWRIPPSITPDRPCPEAELEKNLRRFSKLLEGRKPPEGYTEKEYLIRGLLGEGEWLGTHTLSLEARMTLAERLVSLHVQEGGYRNLVSKMFGWGEVTYTLEAAIKAMRKDADAAVLEVIRYADTSSSVSLNADSLKCIAWILLNVKNVAPCVTDWLRNQIEKKGNQESSDYLRKVLEFIEARQRGSGT
ncbi:MAG: hypothetical protein IJR99_16185 [Kiritimatiellae bacterium]|nr:hypothetical protein [Kiritimatiellia bacterium]